MVVNSVHFCYGRSMQLRAPTIMTMHGPTLRDHCIGIDGDRIAYIRPIAEAPHDAEVIDLPHTTLLPGFVNAHCHLDLSHLRGKVPFTGSFADWIRSVVTMRAHLTEDAVQDAARELQQSGVTSIYDHVGAHSELSYIIDTPFRKRLFLEVIGVTPETAKDNWGRQQERAIQLMRDGIEATPSPHAPYSLHHDTLEQLIGNATEMLSIHYAESLEEQESGFLKELGVTIDALPMPFPSHFLAVHCNTVTDSDIQRLASIHATVVHCPRSHQFFNHPPFPLEKLRAAGIPIAIGTDSLASCPNFNFIEELQALREEFSILKTEDILQMATYRSQITPGAFADIIGLPQQSDLLKGSVSFRIFNGQHNT